MADVAALTQNKDYIQAIHKIWENAAGKKTYITGGIGSSGGWEGFGPEYELPNQSAYCETCAGIGNVYWNHRMFMLTGESKYMDMVERTPVSYTHLSGDALDLIHYINNFTL